MKPLGEDGWCSRQWIASVSCGNRQDWLNELCSKEKTQVSLDSTNDSWINISYPSWSFLTPSYIATAYRISALDFYHHLVIELGRSTITLNTECPQGSWVPISRIALTPPLSRSLKMETLHYGGSFPFLHSPYPQSALLSLVSFLFPGETLLPWGHSLDMTTPPRCLTLSRYHW